MSNMEKKFKELVTSLGGNESDVKENDNGSFTIENPVLLREMTKILIDSMRKNGLSDEEISEQITSNLTV